MGSAGFLKPAAGSIRRRGRNDVLVRHVRQKGNLTGALDRDRELALMRRAGAGRAAGQNLAALGREPAQLRRVLVVNGGCLVHAERANLSAQIRTSLVIRHNEILLSLR